MPYFENSSGVNIYFETIGEGRPIIFIHPPLLGHNVFKYQKKLSEHFKVILFDGRGHGKSSYKPCSGGVLDTHVKDLRDLVEFLNIKKPIIVGYSNGGLIAQLYALKFPNDIEVLIFFGGYPVVNSITLAMIYQLGIGFMKTNNKTLLSYILSRTHAVTEEDQKELFVYMLKANNKSVLELYCEGKDTNLIDQLSKFNNLPILAIYGMNDWYTKKYNKFYSGLKQSKTVLVEGATHQIPIRCHEEVNAAITHFLRDL
ncbi:alpha/beta fold hydrolase [Terrilactibacillus laevilacticus]|uniref:Alpha/beta fold hydrolase n=1 Tax=Terrilactibacillus laevilacticus TaxID=1380157 RepID=A0ABW5PPF9_9BACI|nr:alpha/beta hydrolase [Terrilactibacillus laevilacticus]